MALSAELSADDFRLMREYIRQHCAIDLSDEKAYLVNSRLSKLVAENGCKSFGEFHQRLASDTTTRLRDKVIDAMTTNETLWFRDTHPFTILREKLLPDFEGQFRRGRKAALRIWSAACSTGQEPYSVAMTLHEYHRAGGLIAPSQVQIVGTDISSSALFLARNGR